MTVKKSMKKLISIGLVMVMALSVTACGGKTGSTGTVQSASGNSGSIGNASGASSQVSTGNSSGEGSQTGTANVQSTNSNSGSNSNSGNTQSKVLVAYFSRYENISHPDDVDVVASASISMSNNTRVGNVQYIAQQIASKTNADLFSIRTEKKYSDDYRESTVEARNEQGANERPALSTHVNNMSDYDVIYVGFPNWWGTMPQAVFTFLEEYDMTGKTIIPFCSHGGSRLGSAVRDMKSTCPNSSIVENGLAISADNAVTASTSGEIDKWLEQIK